MERIKNAEKNDPKLQKFRRKIQARHRTDLCIYANRSRHFSNRLCMSKGEIQQEIFLEAYNLVYFIHLGGTKMYQD